jgi:transcription antitermination protein NusB
MTSRHRAREVVLQLLFQQESTDEAPSKILQLYRESFAEGPLPDQFCVDLFTKITTTLPEIDQTIIRASENWRIERMSRVDRNILRLAVYELVYNSDTPPKVVINEAVELAKRFGAEESPSFVNGVLDRIAKESSKID